MQVIKERRIIEEKPIFKKWALSWPIGVLRFITQRLLLFPIVGFFSWPVVEGKEIVLVDDSIVRSTTITKVIRMLREAGARKVHVRISSPMILESCIYGIDTPYKKHLIAWSKKGDVEQIRKYVGADSLGYLSIDGLIRAVGLPKESFCLACFTGDYPVPVQLEMDKLGLETFPDAG